MPKPPLLGEVASSEAKMSERLYRAAPALFRSLERRPLSDLSVSHPLDSSPGRRALGKEVSSSMKLICVCRKTSRNAKASPTRKDSPGRGRWHASAERGQWHRAKRRCRRGFVPTKTNPPHRASPVRGCGNGIRECLQLLLSQKTTMRVLPP